MDGKWHIQLLGGLRASQADRVVSRFQSYQTGCLLAYLAYYQQRAHHRDELVELLWSGSDPATGRHRLRQALYSLRRQFEPPGAPAGVVIAADSQTVRLSPAAITTDVAQFKAALRGAAQASTDHERARLLAQTVDQYGGELLPGYHEDWALQERQWLTESYFEALGRLLAHLEREGDYQRALEYARRRVAADPLREEAHRDLIRLSLAAGEPAAALRRYRELERRLSEELGTAPEAATRAPAREIGWRALLRSQALLSSSALVPQAGIEGESLQLREGENRLATVLCVDLRPSFGTTAPRASETRAPGNGGMPFGSAQVDLLLTAVVDVVLKYEGRVDRLVGDSVLAVFGALQAHEDDVERAIRAALEIWQAALRLSMEVATGVHTGEVSVSAAGPRKDQVLTIIGPAVEGALRLQQRAGPDGILVSEATYRLSWRAFEFALVARGKEGRGRSTTAYAVARSRLRPEKARGIEGLRAELVGRDDEMAKLKQAMAELRQGRGQIAVLTGEAGIGKSRLVAELRQAVSSEQ